MFLARAATNFTTYPAEGKVNANAVPKFPGPTMLTVKGRDE
jgi:hypothetical protein